MTLLSTWVGKILCLTFNQAILKVFNRFLGISFGSIFKTGTNHSFLGFDFKLSWTHPKDELLKKQMLSSSSLSKIKRYLLEMVGEKRENYFFCHTSILESSIPLLNMKLFCLPGLENPLPIS